MANKKLPNIFNRRALTIAAAGLIGAASGPILSLKLNFIQAAISNTTGTSLPAILGYSAAGAAVCMGIVWKKTRSWKKKNEFV